MLDMLLLGMIAASVSVTISESSLFKSLRGWLDIYNPFLGEMISCCYCTSHWVALIIFILKPVVVITFSIWPWFTLILNYFILVHITTVLGLMLVILLIIVRNE
jgi:hypothetical protein